MKKTFPLITSCIILLSFLSSAVLAQPTTNGASGSQSCQGSDPRAWNNCVGTFAFPNGNVYSGQWQNGMRQGNGKIRIVAKGQSNANYIGSDIPSTYVGQFSNNRMNGHGVWTTDGGEKFEGNFVDNVLVSQGSAPAQSNQKSSEVMEPVLQGFERASKFTQTQPMSFTPAFAPKSNATNCTSTVNGNVVKTNCN